DAAGGAGGVLRRLSRPGGRLAPGPGLGHGVPADRAGVPGGGTPGAGRAVVPAGIPLRLRGDARPGLQHGVGLGGLLVGKAAAVRAGGLSAWRNSSSDWTWARRATRRRWPSWSARRGPGPTAARVSITGERRCPATTASTCTATPWGRLTRR